MVAHRSDCWWISWNPRTSCSSFRTALESCAPSQNPPISWWALSSHPRWSSGLSWSFAQILRTVSWVCLQSFWRFLKSQRWELRRVHPSWQRCPWTFWSCVSAWSSRSGWRGRTSPACSGNLRSGRRCCTCICEVWAAACLARRTSRNSGAWSSACRRSSWEPRALSRVVHPSSKTCQFAQSLILLDFLWYRQFRACRSGTLFRCSRVRFGRADSQ